jgi:hypothetical protein
MEGRAPSRPKYYGGRGGRPSTVLPAEPSDLFAPVQKTTKVVLNKKEQPQGK